MPGAVVLPGTVDHCVLTVCVLYRDADHYVLHSLPGDDDDGLGHGLLDRELHALGQFVHCTVLVTNQLPQVLDLLVLGLLDEELHALGQVLDMLGQGLLDEELHTLGIGQVLDLPVQGLHDGELHTIGQVVQDKVVFPERGQSQVSRVMRLANMDINI